jgi:hypothetical protein
VLPVLGPLPVTWQTRDMAKPLKWKLWESRALYQGQYLAARPQGK